MAPQQDQGRLVVARFQDGRVLKGTTQDFSPGKPTLHLFLWGEEHGKPVAIPIGALKAIFFVKSYSGDPERDDAYDFEVASGQGRRVRVTFQDGEVVSGFTFGYSPDKPGFFVIPADPGSNNVRIFVVAKATKAVEWISAASPVLPGVGTR